MINKNDELLHEFKKNKNWKESFNINFVSKKNKLFGAADIDFLFNNNQIQTSWIIIFNNRIYENTELIDFDGRLNSKRIGNKKFEYSIITSFEKFRLILKNESITANIYLSGIFPIFDFPENIVDDELTGTKSINKTWNKYEQRCKISGDISVKAGEDKGRKINFDCFGQREHMWGIINSNYINCQSRITVQFRDTAMNLTYIEKDTIPESNGFISKKSGNIPIINVECESMIMNNNNDGLISTEFSYKDAQDDVDLLVGKSIYSIPMIIPKNKRRNFLRFRNFSEFTVIGTNKKGYGVEEHYISKEMLELFQNTE